MILCLGDLCKEVVLGAPETDWSVIASVVSAVTALIAVIVGPILQWRVSKREAIDRISEKRQVWIDALREDCARFLALAARLEELKRPNSELSDEDVKLVFDERAKTELDISELAIRIRLRLNPNEAAHNEWRQSFEDLAKACKDPPKNETDAERASAQMAFFEAREKLVGQLQNILKNEWDRIKSGGA